VAWHVAELLANEPSAPPVITCHQLVPELAEDAAAASSVVVVDARDDGSPPGSVSVTTPSRPRGQVRSVVSHGFGPADLLALAAELYGAHPDAVVVSVAVAATDVGIGLSPQVAAAVPVAAAAVCQTLRDVRL